MAKNKKNTSFFCWRVNRQLDDSFGEHQASGLDYTFLSNQSAAPKQNLADEYFSAVTDRQDLPTEVPGQFCGTELTKQPAATEGTSTPPVLTGFFTKLKTSLMKTRENISAGFCHFFCSKKNTDDLCTALEEQLIVADVGIHTTQKIINKLLEYADKHRHSKNNQSLYCHLRAEMAAIIAQVESPLVVTAKSPFIILIVGVNGVGKTTTIGKLARQYQAEGKSIMLAAGDTFRAAAVDQLQVWGALNQIPVIAQHTGADAAAVIFEAIHTAKTQAIDILIADTAGRLHNKASLMEELKKIVRVIKKLDCHAPHELMLILDASTGQNAVSQTKLFHEAVGLTGITLTKLDGTAKGGVIFSIADRFRIPIRYISVGEGIEDLQPFKTQDFIEALFFDKIKGKDFS